MAGISELKKEIKRIKERNKKVEADKSWETSWTRKFVIFVLTYLTIAVYFYATGLPDPLVNSLVPALAFVISASGLTFFKRYWMRYIYKK